MKISANVENTNFGQLVTLTTEGQDDFTFSLPQHKCYAHDESAAYALRDFLALDENELSADELTLVGGGRGSTRFVFTMEP